MYSYYPGCSLHSTGKEYDMSFKAVCAALDIELQEVKSWICCGASSAHQTSSILAASLPIKNLCEVEKENLDKVIVPCAACYSRFKTAIHSIENNTELRKNVDTVIGYQFQNKIKIVHPLEIFKNGWGNELKKNIKKDLSTIKVVCYYGCLLTRPPKIMQFDACEYPVSMDEILTSVGTSVLNWSYKTDCCGAALSLTKTEIILRLVNNIFEEASDVGADAIAVACPLCHANLDMRQEEVNKTYNKNYSLPIVYFTQILGLALGCEPATLGLDKHFVSTLKLLEKINFYV